MKTSLIQGKYKIRIVHWQTHIVSDLHLKAHVDFYQIWAGLILDLRPANERRRYKVTPSLFGRAQT